MSYIKQSYFIFTTQILHFIRHKSSNLFVFQHFVLHRVILQRITCKVPENNNLARTKRDFEKNNTYFKFKVSLRFKIIRIHWKEHVDKVLKIFACKDIISKINNVALITIEHAKNLTLHTLILLNDGNILQS